MTSKRFKTSNRPTKLLASPQKQPSNSMDQSMESRPFCGLCRTDEFLVFEHVLLLINPRRTASPVWELEFWCGKCETFYGFRSVHPPKDPRVVQAALRRTIRSTGKQSVSQF